MEISNLRGLGKGNTRGDSSSHIVRIFQEEVDASLTWEFVKWMREVTDLPIFVKVSESLVVHGEQQSWDVHAQSQHVST